MKNFLLQFFTWWNGQTLGTRFFTWRAGERVGEDEFGNVYYRQRGGDRRWVIYNGVAEASAVPPSWHGWLHYTVDVPPTEETYEAHSWEKPYQPNMTGTPYAYRPPGSILTPESRPRATGDYDAWTP
ncbi:MAG: NADH:ubiquinone oxidoreductase subunit NDUFA12 [Flavobacteriaceae bacterium]